jgi:hypothetical protein
MIPAKRNSARREKITTHLWLNLCIISVFVCCLVGSPTNCTTRRDVLIISVSAICPLQRDSDPEWLYLRFSFGTSKYFHYLDEYLPMVLWLMFRSVKAVAYQSMSVSLAVFPLFFLLQNLDNKMHLLYLTIASNSTSPLRAHHNILNKSDRYVIKTQFFFSHLLYEIHGMVT